MPGKRWNEWEIVRLRDLLAKALAASEMTISTRTAAAIQQKAIRLGWVGDGISRAAWSDQDVNTLRLLSAQRLTVAQMLESGKLNSHSIAAVRTKLSRLGFVDKRRSRASRQAIRMSIGERMSFCEFLCARVARCTPEQMALMWNQQHELKVNHGRVVRYLEMLGIKCPRSEVIQMPFSKAKRARRSQKYLASQRKRWRKYRRELELRFIMLAQQMRAYSKENGKTLEQRVCQNCEKQWPAVAAFFCVTKKQTRAGAQAYLYRTCKLCGARRRRLKAQRAKVPAKASLAVDHGYLRGP